MTYIESLEKALGIEANKNMLPMQPGDVPGTSADTQPLFEAIEFRPQTGVEEGVQSFVDWYRRFYQR
jgi:UDP-glucuronate 4-epimerase